MLRNHSLSRSRFSPSGNPSRRRFLKDTVGAVAALGFPTIVPSSVFGAHAPSNRIVLGGIGLGGQGTYNMQGFLGRADVHWAAVCDVDRRHLQRAKETVDARQGGADCAAYADFRELLARDDIDAVSIASPDHWHALHGIFAARAGKDIYGEKPISHDLREGRAMVRAVGQYGRVWQTGSWQRSVPNFHHAAELVRNGRLGKVVRVEVGLPDGKPGPVNPVSDPPEGLDWDAWLGPVPLRPYRGVSHGNWRWILDWGGGQLLDWIGHHLDIANWALDLEGTGPVKISGMAEFPEKGLYDAPVSYRVDCEYADGLALTLANASQMPRGMGTRWIGEDGSWIWVDRGSQASLPVDLWDERIGPGEQHLYFSRDHIGNFLDCIRSRSPAIAPAEAAHRAASVGHLGMISILTGRELRWNPDREEILRDPGASALLGRAYRQPWSLA